MSNASITNQRLIQLINEPGGTEKVAAASSAWVKDRVYEESFATKVQTMEPKTPSDPDVQVSTDSDQLHVIIPVAPNSAAMSINFRAEGDAEIIRARRVAAGFYTITSNVYNTYEESLDVYDKLNQPLTKIIEDRIPLDIQKILDRGWLVNVEAAVQAMQQEANGGSATELSNTTLGSTVEYSVYKGANARDSSLAKSATPLPLARADLGTLKNILVNKQLLGTTLLISDWDWNNQMALTHEELGSDIAGTYEKGFTATTLNGLKVVKSIKTDVLRPGNLYVFTDEEYFGRLYNLRDVKFYLEKKVNKITFQGRWRVASALVNVNAVGKIELYTGDASGATVGVLSDVYPKAEDDLWAVNNRVEEGVYFPSPTVF